MISSSAAKGSSIRISRGLRHHRAGDRDAHLHAARQLARVGAGERLEADERAAPPATSSRAASRDLPAQAQRQPDVLGDRGPGHQRRLLEDEADVARAVPARPDDPPRGRPHEPRDQPQRRRLAAARRPQQRDEVALVDLSATSAAARRRRRRRPCPPAPSAGAARARRGASGRAGQGSCGPSTRLSPRAGGPCPTPWLTKSVVSAALQSMPASTTPASTISS